MATPSNIFDHHLISQNFAKGEYKNLINDLFESKDGQGWLSSPGVFHWLPVPKFKNVDGDEGFFSYANRKNSIVELHYNLLVASMPAILGKDYHTMKIKDNINFKSEDFGMDLKIALNQLKLGAWHVKFCETFGYELCRLMQDRFLYFNYEAPENDKNWVNPVIVKKLPEWYLHTFFILSAVCKFYQTGMSPMDPIIRQGNEECRNAKDFILEPTVLVQLPWKPVLLHQWVSAALSEVNMCLLALQ
jgi:hypothetical protein